MTVPYRNGAAPVFVILTIVLGIAAIGLTALSLQQRQQINDLTKRLTAALAQAGLDTVVTGSDFPALKSANIDQDKTKQYEGKNIAFAYFSGWVLRENKAEDGSVTEVEVASQAELFGGTSAPDNQGILRIRQQKMSYLTNPDDYLAQTPYATKNRKFTLPNGQKALETYNEYQGRVWHETIIFAGSGDYIDKEEAHVVVTAIPAKGAGKQAYDIFLSSLKTTPTITPTQ